MTPVLVIKFDLCMSKRKGQRRGVGLGLGSGRLRGKWRGQELETPGTGGTQRPSLRRVVQGDGGHKS